MSCKFAWLPHKTGDTERWIWLRKVYIEKFGRTKYYYEKENPF